MSNDRLLPVIELEEVSKHNKLDDLWVAIDGKVFDLTRFAEIHPGGIPPLMDAAGEDATDLFYELHRASLLQEERFQRFVIGTYSVPKPAKLDRNRGKPVPYGQSHGSWRVVSPYYSESHEMFRAAMREFVAREIMPTCVEDDEEGTYPSQHLNMKLAQAGIIACLGLGEPNGREWTKRLGIELPGGVQPDDFDLFHSMILSEEVRATGCYGFGDGLFGGQSIGFPPLLKFGSDELVARIAPEILLGQKRICLAVTEPYAGSDVAQIKTRGEKMADGSWRVTGVKKWITGGMFAEYFTTLVSTAEGMAMMVIERDEDEVSKLT